MHFEGRLGDDPRSSTSTLGPMSEVLAGADLSMVNLESALTDRGPRARKELEDRALRYWFRTGPAALDVLARSGVVRIRGTDVAVHAADASPREGASPIWAATPGSGPGIAAARGAQTSALLASVRESARVDDLVVVYLHWGEEGNASSTGEQERLAADLARAGADVVVGTHAHTPLGAGTKAGAYVSYGLGNFYWYHGRESETGVLRLTVSGDEVVADEWAAARIPERGGALQPLTGAALTRAEDDWLALRDRTDLAPGPGPGAARPAGRPAAPALPAFTATVDGIGTAQRRRMPSHSDARCPVALDDLRHLTLAYVGFDGRAHRGDLVVHSDVADDVVGVFEAMYDDRFPVAAMRLVDVHGGDDDRSMAANNTSADSCRTVAGTTRWSDHAYGRAVDVNPVQNPYVVGGEARPTSGGRYVAIDRGPDVRPLPGVIRSGDVVRRAFDRLGWEWGGTYPEPDYQHFSAPPEG